MTTAERPFQNYQCDRIQGYNPPMPPFRKGGRQPDRQGGIERHLNSKTGRNIPKNQGVIKVLKERL